MSEIKQRAALEHWYETVRSGQGNELGIQVPVGANDSSSLQVRLSKETGDSLKGISRGKAPNEFLLLLSTFFIFLEKSRLSPAWISLFGLQGTENHHATTQLFPTASKLELEWTVSELIEQVKKHLNALSSKRGFDFPELLRLCEVNGIAHERDFYRIGFAYTEVNRPSEGELAKFELCFVLFKGAQGYGLQLHHRWGAHANGPAAYFSRLFLDLLPVALSDVHQSLAEACSLTPAELQDLRQKLNPFEQAPPPPLSIGELVDNAAQEHPDRVALHCEGRKMSYGQVSEYSNRLAHFLLSETAVDKGKVVAIYLDRSEHYVLAMLASLKAGACYLPLDPSHPPARNQQLVSETEAAVLITSSDLLQEIPEVDGRIFAMDIELEMLETASTLPQEQPQPSDSAYIIYTSGSTGKPKGVEVSHRAVTRLALNTDYLKIRPEDHLLSLSSFCFDGSVFDVYAALLHGASLTIANKRVFLEPEAFKQLLQDQAITAFFTTTAFFNSLVENVPECFTSVRKVLFGGERVSVKHVEAFLKRYGPERLVHVYGPTENTVFSTWYPVNSLAEGSVNVPIGKPLGDVEALVVDGQGNQVLPYVVGELFLGGEGLAEGYFQDQTLTKEKFVPHPYHADQLVYRTGDLVRVLPDGNIEFVGRADEQVKIRGFRIEIGEIEHALLLDARISEAIVVAREGQRGKQLVAYFTAKEALSAADLVSALEGHIPDYMVPAHFIQLPQFPLNSNGKVDRKALPEHGEQGAEEGFAAPRNPLERQLAEIIGELLDLERVGIHDSFFVLGGDSITAIRLVTRINQELDAFIEVKDVFLHQDVASLADFLSDKSKGSEMEAEWEEARRHVEQVKTDILLDEAKSTRLASTWEDIFPMSPISHGLLYHYLIGAGSGVYHIQIFFQFEDEDFDFELFRHAYFLLVRKHDILRSSFHLYEFGTPIQVVHQMAEEGLDISYQEVHHLDSEEQKEWFADYLAEDRKHPFDPEQPGLWRMRIFRLGENEYTALWIFSHAIMDGWSDASFMAELTNVYHSLKTQPNYTPVTLKAGYKDFIIDQMRYLHSDRVKTWWKDRLEGSERTPLPLHKQVPADVSMDKSECGFVLKGDLLNQLKALSHRSNINIKEILLACFAGMVAYATNSEDLTLGLITHGRPDIEDGERIIGCLVSSTAIRIPIPYRITGNDFLDRVKEISGELKSYDKLALGEISGLIDEDKGTANPIFDILFAYYDFHVWGEAHEDSKIKQSDIGGYGVTNTYFDFILLWHGEELHGGIVALEALYSAGELDRLKSYFLNLLERICSTPELPLLNPSLLGSQEKRLLLDGRDEAQSLSPPPFTISELFERTAEAHALREALTFGDNRISYGDLNRRCNQVAHYLRQEWDVQPDTVIGILMDRSEMVVVAMLAILKAGGAYLPIDPEFPEQRIQLMLEDAEVKGVLTHTEHLFLLQDYGGQLFAMDVQLDGLSDPVSNPPSVNKPSDLAYIIYTSGSTGNPKGVMVEHQGVTRLVHGSDYFQCLPADTILGLSPFSFDGATFDIFAPLLNGGRCVVGQKKLAQNLELLASTIQKERISALFITTALFNLVMDSLPDAFSGLRSVLFGGERVSAPHVRTFLQHHGPDKLVHVYGPTENTTYSTWFPVSELPADADNVPIGKSISGSELFVLNGVQDLLPLGAEGELCLGGPGLARAYLNAEDLNREKFVPHPFRADEKIYRTGDRVKMTEKGNVLFVGRMDEQVKIRGFRIEPGEIRSTLLKHPEITEAIALVRKDNEGQKMIVAYLSGPSELASDSLIAWMKELVPAYMVPDRFVQLAEFPLNRNGKIDLKALPDDPESMLRSGQAHVAPRNDLEEGICAIWQDILGLEKISIHDNFFELGGHSLKATRAVSRMLKELDLSVTLQEMFSSPTIAKLAAGGRTGQKAGYAPIPKTEEADFYELSFAQRRLWVLDQWESGTTTYNIPGTYLLEGPLDTAAFEKAIESLLLRHESLRTIFHTVDGQPVQFIHSFPQSTCSVTDLSDQPDPMQAAMAYAKADAETPYDLSTGPLYRFALLKVAADKHLWVLNFHHIISDGWSAEIITRELVQAYTAWQSGSPPTFPDLSIQYKDYAHWQQELIRGDAGLQTFWEGQLSGNIPELKLPTDFPRPALKTYRGAHLEYDIPNELAEDLQLLSQSSGSSLFMVLTALVKTLLHRYSGQEDIILGTPIAGRNHPDLEDQVGFYVNLLPLRSQIQSGDSFSELLAKVHETTSQAYDHQAYPIDKLIDSLDLGRNLSRAPLYDVLVVLHNYELARMDLPDVQLSKVESELQTSKYDLTFGFIEHEGGMKGGIEYNSDLFLPETVRRICEHLLQLASEIVQQPERSISDFDLMTASEVVSIATFSTSPQDYPREKTIPELFREQAATHPDRTALIGADGSMSYKELDRKSEQLAQHLRQEFGIQQADCVGIVLDRSMEYVVAMLGILKAGGAYVPISPDLPPQRQNLVIADTGLDTIVTSSDYMFELEDYSGNVFAIDIQLEDLPPASTREIPSYSSEQLAYVLYTSGSTGTPKGVMVPHRAVVRLVKNSNFFELGEGDRVLQTGSMSFDASTFEVWGPLLNGAGLLEFGTQQLLDPPTLKSLIETHRVSTMWFTSAWFNQLVDIDPQIFEPLKHVLVGGEALSPKHISLVRERFPSLKITNGYGPTENTTFSATYSIEKPYDSPIPIGGPIANSEVHILDERLKKQPIGVPGEICVAGDGLALGYLNDPELTAQKFVLHPEDPTRQMYLTGDWGKWNPDGSISFLGRKDDQVKLRGFRIEPKEIEAHILAHGEVRDCLVLLKENADGKKLLQAYYLADETLPEQALAAHLAQGLPAYMVPEAWLRMESFPLNQNGKVDRQALRALDPNSASVESAQVLPTTQLQRDLAAIWTRLLKLDQIGLHDNYFVLGGDSIKSIELVSTTNRELGLHLEVRHIFKYPTLAELAQFLEETAETRGSKDVSIGRKRLEALKQEIQANPTLAAELPETTADFYPLADVQQGMIFHNLLESNAQVYHDQLFHEFSAADFSFELFQQAVDLLTDKHDALRISIHIGAFPVPIQVLHKTGSVQHRVHFESLVHLDEEAQMARLDAVLAEDREHSFELGQPGLTRFRLFQTAADQFLLFRAFHHAVWDGWSDGVYVTDLMQTYARLLQDPSHRPPELKASFKDFILEQESLRADAEAIAFWKGQLAGFKKTPWPLGKVRASNEADQGRSGRVLQIGQEEFERLERLSKEIHVGIKDILLGAFLTMLRFVTNEDDLSFGLLTHARPDIEDGDKLIGCFLNTVPFRMQFESQWDASELMRNVAKQGVELKSYDKYSLAGIKALAREQEGHSELFDTFFGYFDFHIYRGESEGEEISQSRSVGFAAADTPFDFFAIREAQGMVVTLSTLSSLYSTEEMDAMLGIFSRILKQFVEQPKEKLDFQALLPAAELSKMLGDWNDTQTGLPSPVSIHGQFSQWAKRHPHRPAAIHKGRQLSFQELENEANRLAAYLLEEVHLKPGERVFLSLDPSFPLLQWILAVSKVRGVYAATDPYLPENRKATLLKLADARLVVDEAFHNSLDLPSQSRPIEVAGKPEDTALINFTSGSSGMPKGVQISHENVINLIDWFKSYFDLTDEDVFPQKTSLSFTDSMVELLLPICGTGGPVHLPPIPRVSEDFGTMFRWFKEIGMSIVQFVPTVFDVFSADYDMAELDGLRHLILSGEALKNSYNFPFPVYNLYGCTEGAAISTAHRLQAGYSAACIGKPISNTQAFIVDKELNILPTGVPGELVLAGKSVSAGYVNNPAETAKVFESNHFEVDGLRYPVLYHTGDLARWLPDGNIEYLGRIDAQIKLRGIRIEPSEIEQAMLAFEGISASAIALKKGPNGLDFLCAYYESLQAIDEAALKQHLASTLPAYLLPSVFVQLETMPLTVSGKINRRALPEPESFWEKGKAEYVAPRNELEQIIVDIWSELLNDREIGVKDNFFELGGHSLLATRMISRLQLRTGISIQLKALFEHPSVEALAMHVGGLETTSQAGIEPLAPQADYAISHAQKRLWILDQMGEGNIAYSMPGAVRLQGAIDYAALEAAFQSVIATHESLRTSFQMLGDEPRQFIHESVPFSLEMLDFSMEDDPREAIQAHIHKELERPFDLREAPLFRAGLYGLAENDRVLFLNTHHIVSDGWSMTNLAADLLDRYHAAAKGEALEKTSFRIQYKDFAAWQNQQLESGAESDLKDWWHNYLAAPLPLLELPYKGTRPAVKTYAGDIYNFKLSEGSLDSLTAFARTADVSLFMLLLAGVNVLLHRYSQQEDIIVGTPVAGRPYPELESQIGLYVNLLPLRNRIDPAESFSSLLEKIRENTLAALDRQLYPFDSLVDELDIVRDTSRSPIVDVAVAMMNLGQEGKAFEGVRSEQFHLPHLYTKFDLTFNFAEIGQDLHLALEYNTDLFDREVIERLSGHLKEILDQVIEVPGQQIKELQWFSDVEAEKVYAGFNQTAAEFPSDASITSLFEARVALTPEATALEFGDQSLSYAEVNAKANAFAHMLLEKGLQSEDPVALWMERGFEMVIAMLGTLKAGGAYLPISPDYPTDRVDFCLQDSSSRFLVVNQDAAIPAQFLGTSIQFTLDALNGRNHDNPGIRIFPDQLIYILYTSGSTGRPKGVMMEHRSIVNRIHWMAKEYGFEAKDKVIQKTPYVFDVSVWEFFMTLCYGATLTLCEKEVIYDPARLRQVIGKHAITTLHFVPGMYTTFLAEAVGGDPNLKSLKRVFCSGEALEAHTVRRHYHVLDGVPLHNLYGPTEAAVDVSYYLTRPEDRFVPIGKPIDNIQLYVLDQEQALVPVGVPGELCIAGVGLARGYLNRPELNAEKFIQRELFPERGPQRLYRTGDKCRWMPDGNIEFMGRFDDQVKIRGLRIELGEISHQILGHEAVGEVNLQIQGQGPDASIMAFIRPSVSHSPLLSKALQIVRHQPELERAWHELPNGLGIFQSNPQESEFLFEEIFTTRSYLAQGVSLQKGDVVLDVGANVGMFSLFMGLHFPEVEVYAFEPIPPVYQKLKANADLYLHLQVKAFPFGLSREAGQAEFIHYPGNTLISGKHTDLQSDRETLRAYLRQGGQGELNADEIESILEESLKGVPYTCELRSLSQVIAEEGIQEIALLKVDVERSEYEVLAGISEGDWQRIRQVIVEVQDVDGNLAKVRELLDAQGYEVHVEAESMLQGTELYNVFAHRSDWKPSKANEDWHTGFNASFGKLTDSIKEHCKAQLPAYMVPSDFKFLSEFPLTHNGKVNRKALVQQPGLGGRSSQGFAPPTTEMQKALVKCWEETLGKKKIGIHDNFFDLGGHSLRATKLGSLVRREKQLELKIMDIFAHPTVAEQANLLEQKAILESTSISPVPDQDFYPVSHSQRRLWVMDQMEKELSAYNIPMGLRLLGPVNEGLLKTAMERVVERHESLRTTFKTVEGEPVQVVHPQVELPWRSIDLQDQENAEGEARKMVQEDMVQGFDLIGGPVFRILFIHLGAEDQVLFINLHHIAGDGWSVNVLFNELITIYSALQQNREPNLPTLPIQYRDFATWQMNALENGGFDASRAFWKSQFDSEVSILNLQLDHPRPSPKTYDGAQIVVPLESEAIKTGRRLVRNAKGTDFTLYLSLVNLLLHRYTGQADIVLGTPVAGREHADAAHQIGFYVNTLALRNQVDPRDSFETLLKGISENTTAAYDHAAYPFDQLVVELDIPRDLSRSPLFDVMVTHHNLEAISESFEGVQVEPFLEENSQTKFDLTFNFTEREGEMQLVLEYNSNLFEAETIRGMGRHFQSILKAAVQHPTSSIGQLRMMDRPEMEAVFEMSKGPDLKLPAENILEWFQQVTAQYPDRTVVEEASGKTSFRELDLKSNRLAHYLLDRKIDREELVGIRMRRSADLLVAKMAILKAGAAYLPLFVNYPAERVAYQLRTAKTRLVICDQARETGDAESVILSQIPLDDFPDTRPALSIDSDSLAYVIFTSGSTGNPKGVMVSHKSLVDICAWFHDAYDAGIDSRGAAYSGIAFDASVMEYWAIVVAGGCVYPVPEELKLDLPELSKFMFQHRITHIFLPTAICEQYSQANAPAMPQYLRFLTGGERLQFADTDKLWVINNYGPTENTVMSSYLDLRAYEGNDYPIGRPVTNSSIYILDPHMQPVPVGVAGEMYLAGNGVAKGYLGGSPEEQRRFMADPFVLGRRMYKTGDRAKYKADGLIHFLGRNDEQVQIRGIRVEPQEVAEVLKRHPQVRTAAVIAHEGPDGRPTLCAYYVPEQEIPEQELKNFIARFLPEGWLPTYWVQMAEMPVGPTGKLDRKALPPPEYKADYDAPETELEALLAKVMGEILQKEEVSVTANFFYLGGDSINAIQMSARLHAEGWKMNLKDLYNAPTVRSLAPFLSKIELGLDQTPYEGPIELSPIQRRFFELQGFENHWNQSMILRFESRLDVSALQKALEHLLRHHDALRIRFLADITGAQQVNAPVEEGVFHWEEWDLRGLPDTDREHLARAQGLQESLDLETGKLLAAGLVHADDSDHLLLAVHHLVVDGVSWRIILEDLNTAYAALASGQEVQLPPKSHSFGIWANRLGEYAGGRQMQEELAYWQSVSPSVPMPLPKKTALENVPNAGSKRVILQLTEVETNQLLTEAQLAYNTNINDLLLTALEMALAAWTGRPEVLIAMEGHGRESILPETDISRTVGWFTSIYPVLLQSTGDDLGQRIKATKENLRRIPNKGVGYGILKYMGGEAQQAALPDIHPEIAFNYLGTFSADNSEGSSQWSHLSMGDPHSPQSKREYPLTINGSVTEGRLAFALEFHPDEFEEQKMEELGELFRSALVKVLEHCIGKEEQEYTPSDFDQSLSEEELDEILGLFD